VYSTRLEGIAEDVLARTGCDVPVDAFEVAARLGLTVELAHPRADVRDALIYDRTIFLSRRVAVSAVHQHVTHEVAHAAMWADGVDDTEEHANYLGAAILVPRRALIVALRAGWDLEALRRQHVNAPAALIAKRVALVREGTAAVYDGTRFVERVGPEQRVEAELRDRALATGRPARTSDCTGAWPLGGKAVVVLVEAA
jgi:hypothetical protein